MILSSLSEDKTTFAIVPSKLTDKNFLKVDFQP